MQEEKKKKKPTGKSWNLASILWTRVGSEDINFIDIMFLKEANIPSSTASFLSVLRDLGHICVPT